MKIGWFPNAQGTKEQYHFDLTVLWLMAPAATPYFLACLMFEWFGKKWFTSYTEDNFQPEYYPRGVIEVIK